MKPLFTLFLSTITFWLNAQTFNQTYPDGQGNHATYTAETPSGYVLTGGFADPNTPPGHISKMKIETDGAGVQTSFFHRT